MKKQHFFLAALTALVMVFNSCSKDNEEATKPASIVGVWEFSQQGNIAADGTVSSLKAYNNGCPSEKDNFTFTSPNGFSHKTLFENKSRLRSAEATLSAPDASSCGSNLFTGTYPLSGENLTTIDNEYGTRNFVVISLSATELKLKQANRIKGALPGGKTALDGSAGTIYILTKRQ
jgi:hypothetical protein